MRFSYIYKYRQTVFAETGQVCGLAEQESAGDSRPGYQLQINYQIRKRLTIGDEQSNNVSFN